MVLNDTVSEENKQLQKYIEDKEKELKNGTCLLSEELVNLTKAILIEKEKENKEKGYEDY